MGFKKRPSKFTGTLQTAILQALRRDNALSKRELLAHVKEAPNTQASVRNLGLALRRLIADGKIVLRGSRADARFEQAN